MQLFLQRNLRANFVAILLLSMGAVAAGSERTPSADQPPSGFDDPVVTFVDQRIRQVWEDNEVRPSRVADDAEWLRRVHLDITGRIPSATQVGQFLRSDEKTKRSQVIDELLDSPAYARNWTNIWTNLLLGRETPRRTSRNGMRNYLREAFLRNQPWNEMVHDLLTAEGHYEENGAVNFLLGQLNGNPRREDYTTEVTARVTRLFLGTQVQCTQCHDHPFNDWKQVRFWEIDSFFKQIQRIDRREFDVQTGQRTYSHSELGWRNYSGPVYFEKRSGVVEVAYPRFAGQEVNADAPTDRRRKLAAIMTQEDPDRQLARAAVNRMWGHFFGYGFTQPVDDMGPHNPPSHPQVLERLTQEFVASGYDLKQLIRWICHTEAYQLTSMFNRSNRIDDPAAGEAPLFSRMSVKPLTPEQMYDSLLVATRADRAGTDDPKVATRRRQEWMNEIRQAFGGSDEDDAAGSQGSVSQALLIMNGPLVAMGCSGQPGTVLHSVLSRSQLRSDAQRIRQLYHAALGRNPTGPELVAARKLIAANWDKLSAYQDLYWALLNSNEFALNH